MATQTNWCQTRPAFDPEKSRQALAAGAVNRTLLPLLPQLLKGLCLCLGSDRLVAIELHLGVGKIEKETRSPLVA